MTSSDTQTLARELSRAFADRQIIAPPSARGDGFDLATGYAVENELVRLRRAAGHKTAGIKVGYANKAMWRVLKLDTLVWAHMYDDTVQYAPGNEATLSVAHMISPKIEPEIVFKMKAPLGAGVTDPAATLEAVEWLALGFEIIDCPYADWKYQPADFVAAYGLHAALIVGEPCAVTPPTSPSSSNSCRHSRCGCRRTERSWRRGPARTRSGVPRSASPSSRRQSPDSRTRSRSPREIW